MLVFQIKHHFVTFRLYSAVCCDELKLTQQWEISYIRINNIQYKWPWNTSFSRAMKFTFSIIFHTFRFAATLENSFSIPPICMRNYSRTLKKKILLCKQTATTRSLLALCFGFMKGFNFLFQNESEYDICWLSGIVWRVLIGFLLLYLVAHIPNSTLYFRNIRI